MGANSRHLAHELIVAAFKKSGLTKAEVAKRLGWKDRSRISKLLNVPANITVETLGELLFVIDGSEPNYSQNWPCRAQHGNGGHPEWLKVPGATTTTSTSPAKVFYSQEAKAKITRTSEAAL
ncbi:hypothetical protein VW35_02420 [Devosia soli]|uniref:HTH cro/C1-type domain-containing protein n=2 Tax=Devosia soli TaxID=361041 RepID=A0A0F5LHK7_9HYPH|nr:hypothetical protein VW35_02420 [Devosia soli]